MGRKRRGDGKTTHTESHWHRTGVLILSQEYAGVPRKRMSRDAHRTAMSPSFERNMLLHASQNAGKI